MMSLLGTGEGVDGRGARDVLAGIATVSDMVTAFADEERCRRLLKRWYGRRSGLPRLRVSGFGSAGRS